MFFFYFFFPLRYNSRFRIFIKRIAFVGNYYIENMLGYGSSASDCLDVRRTIFAKLHIQWDIALRVPQNRGRLLSALIFNININMYQLYDTQLGPLQTGPEVVLIGGSIVHI